MPAAAMPAALVTPDFEVPLRLKAQDFTARPLTVDDVVRDYDAVMSSRPHILGTFGPESDWPRDDLSLRQNLVDLGWHEKEFQTRRSFAYSLVDPSDRLTLGCLYIYPPRRADHDADVYLWLRASHAHLEARALAEVQRWLAERWPFSRVAYPGRTLAWDEWLGQAST